MGAAAYAYIAMQQAIDDAGLSGKISNPMTGLTSSGGASVQISSQLNTL